MSTMRELKGRIGSVQSSQKITSAMKMISSAKLRKAENALKQIVPFKDQLQGTINNLLGADSDYQSPLTENRPVHRVAFVIFGSDEGLCGAFNVFLYKYLLGQIAEMRNLYGQDIPVTVFPVGRKVRGMVAKTPGIEMRTVDYVDTKSGAGSFKRFAAELTSSFMTHEFDRIEIVYSYYKSIGTQVVKDTTLLPVSVEKMDVDTGKKHLTPYLYEPDPASIFEEVLPLYVRSVLQETAYQSRTSEQAARIMAMQMASDNAKKLLDDLQLEYNKLRQQSITAELLDILGGTVNG